MTTSQPSPGIINMRTPSNPDTPGIPDGFDPCGAVSEPFALMAWIAANREQFKPPVGNKYLYSGRDFFVMIIAGPNARNDFHQVDSEEFFIQLKGDIAVKIARHQRENGGLLSYGHSGAACGSRFMRHHRVRGPTGAAIPVRHCGAKRVCRPSGWHFVASRGVVGCSAAPCGVPCVLRNRRPARVR